MKYLVTVAIASYNNGPFIERCIQSVIDQTYKNIEILIIDDGSNDDTIERIKKCLPNDRIRVIVKENGGLSTVRQRALMEAKGEYICFIDADDYLVDNYVSNLLKAIISDKSDVCVCSTRFEKSDGTLLKKESLSFRCETTDSPIITSPDYLAQNYDSINRLLLLSDSWNKLYRTRTLKETGVSFCMPKGLNGSDQLFNKLLALHGLKYSVISDECYVHVIYSSSAVHRKNKDLHKSFNIITDCMIDECKRIGIGDVLKHGISKDYCNYQQMAVEDVYESSSNYFGIVKSINSIYKDFKCFIDSRNLSIINIKEFDALIVKLFFILFYHCRCLLPFYFRVLSIPGKIRNAKS